MIYHVMSHFVVSLPFLSGHLLCLVMVHGLLVDAQCLVVGPQIAVMIGVHTLTSLASSLQGQLLSMIVLYMFALW